MTVLYSLDFSEIGLEKHRHGFNRQDRPKEHSEEDISTGTLRSCLSNLLLMLVFSMVYQTN